MNYMQAIGSRCKISGILLAVVMLAGCSSQTEKTLDSWSVYHGSLEHTGVYDVEPIRSLENVKWAFKTGGPIRGAAAIMNGTVYFGSGDGYLYALDEETGNEQWRFKTGGAVHSTPLAVNGLLVFTSRDHFIYALNPDDGKEIWKLKTGDILPLDWEFDYYLSSPILAENTIYVGAGDGFVYAINPVDGTIKWKTQTGGRVRTSPAYSDGLLYIGNMSGRFYAIDAGNGDVAWDFEVEGLTSDFEEYGFDRASIIGAAAVKDNTVLFGSRDAFVYALDKRTGEEIWKVSQRGTSWAITSPAIEDNIVYMGTSDALFIHALNLETGEEIWKADSLGANWPSPVIAGDVLYSGNYRREIFALDKRTGDKLWSFRTGHDNLATAVPRDRILLTGSDDGFFYALSGSPGKKDKPTVLKSVHWEYNNARVFHDEIKDYLVEREYELLDSLQVVDFMNERLEDGMPSVVVMAVNLYPGALLKKNGNEKPLLRRYLEAGGKVVWLGTVHMIRTRDQKVLEAYENPTNEILGLEYQNDLRGHKGYIGNTVTPKGYAWGLRTSSWIGCCAVDRNQVDIVLGRDEYGRASAWVKNYGGPPYTGYVKIEGKAEVLSDFKIITDLAEYGF